MSKPLVDRIPFAKILLGFVVLFVLSLGLCGMSAVSDWQGGKFSPGMSRFLQQTVWFDLVGMIVSVAGLVLTAVVWVVMSVISRVMRKDS